MTPDVEAFWGEFLAATGRAGPAAPSDVFFFGDNATDAAELAALVLAGGKRGTASLAWMYENEGRPLPAAGDLSVVTRHDGAPLCVIETTAVEVCRFDDVTPDFAASEGEGDLSLAWWRDVHWRYFVRECARLGREPTGDMPVVCERFRVIHRAADTDIAGHYARPGLADIVLAAAGETLGPDERLTPRHLAPADEFHIGGLEATRRFLPMLGLEPGMRVLDVGSGLGGAARVAAADHGVEVVGIDITPDYVAAARRLSAAVGLDGATRFHCASALDLPFADGSFDAAFTLHVAMNIADKAGLYREVGRVLRPGASFGIYDVLAGPHADDLVFPVPWAGSPAMSFLATPEAVRRDLVAAGFAIGHEEDRHDFAVAFFERLARRLSEGPPPVGLHLVMGASAPQKIANMVANVGARRCGPWEFVARRA